MQDIMQQEMYMMAVNKCVLYFGMLLLAAVVHSRCRVCQVEH